MQTKYRIAFLVILCVAYLFCLYSRADGQELPVNQNTLSVNAMIEEIAPKFGQDPKLISKITWCESQHKVANHDGGRGINITGIHDKTFKSWLPMYEKEMGETLDIKSSYDQLKLMSYVFSKGESYRRQWTTYVAYINGGTYTFYSKLLNGKFTAKCK